MGQHESQPAWAVVMTRSEDLTARDLLRCGYRVYLPRYRKVLWPHGADRRPTSIMVPLFRGMLFAQDWRGLPKHQPIGGEPRLMSAYRGAGTYKLADEDIGIIRERENACAFDEVLYPIGPGMGFIIRDDIPEGTQVEFEQLGTRIVGELQGLSDNGKAFVNTVFGRFEVDAARLSVVAY